MKKRGLLLLVCSILLTSCIEDSEEFEGTIKISETETLYYWANYITNKKNCFIDEIMYEISEMSVVINIDIPETLTYQSNEYPVFALGVGGGFISTAPSTIHIYIWFNIENEEWQIDKNIRININIGSNITGIRYGDTIVFKGTNATSNTDIENYQIYYVISPENKYFYSDEEGYVYDKNSYFYSHLDYGKR